MSSGFAGIMGLLGVFLGGKRAVAAAAVAAPSTGHGGIVRDDRIRYAFVDRDIEDMVRRAIECALEEDRPPKPSKQPLPIPVLPEPASASDADIADAIDRLFTAPMLAALDEKRRLAARAATLEAIRLSELWALEEARTSVRLAREALEADDEDALLALIL